MNVRLDFSTDTPQTPAAQSFVLYPGALALFSYPCPYDDCDGIYDLGPEADQTLSRQRPRVTGLASCTGKRSRISHTKTHCGLSLRYTIMAKHGADASPER